MSSHSIQIPRGRPKLEELDDFKLGCICQVLTGKTVKKTGNRSFPVKKGNNAHQCEVNCYPKQRSKFNILSFKLKLRDQVNGF